MNPGDTVREGISKGYGGVRDAFRRSKHFETTIATPGAAPGAVSAPTNAIATKVRAISYGPDAVEEIREPSIDALPEILSRREMTWIDVRGLGSVGRIKAIADLFGLHRLAVEDVFHVPQRPKVEPYDNCFLVVTRSPSGEVADIALNQISIIFGERWAITVQETEEDLFEPVKKRLHAGKGLLRSEGGDYLAYAALDVAMDQYFPILEEMGERLAELEDEALENPQKSTLRRTNRIRSSLLKLRRVLWPQREALNALGMSDDEMIGEATRVHMRDLQDHVRQAAEVVDSYREIVAGISSTWLSSVGNRTNDVMKVLTIMASIFIPLNFLAAVYGMNFDYMPELHVEGGYFVLIGVMALAALGMVGYFYRKGWLEGSQDSDEG